MTINNTLALETVKYVIEELKKLPYVEDVRAIAKGLDGRRIDFEVLHNYENSWGTLLPEATQDIILDTVFDANWKLRDETNEKWYFDYFFSFQEFGKIYVDVAEVITF